MLSMLQRRIQPTKMSLRMLTTNCSTLQLTACSMLFLMMPTTMVMMATKRMPSKRMSSTKRKTSLPLKIQGSQNMLVAASGLPMK